MINATMAYCKCHFKHGWALVHVAGLPLLKQDTLPGLLVLACGELEPSAEGSAVSSTQ